MSVYPCLHELLFLSSVPIYFTVDIIDAIIHSCMNKRKNDLDPSFILCRLIFRTFWYL